MLETINHKISKLGILAKAIAILSLLLSCADDKRALQKQSGFMPDSAIAVAIIDGDTFTLKSGRTVRIALIDTPELNEPYYDSAAQLLSDLILGKSVNLKPLSGQTDRYGRILAEVFVDSVNTGLSILAHGLGALYLYQDNLHLKEIYLSAQQKALREKIGIWSLPGPEPEDYYINVKGSYRFHRPLCIHLKNVNPAKIQRLESRNEALNLGLSPCRTCRP